MVIFENGPIMQVEVLTGPNEPALKCRRREQASTDLAVCTSGPAKYLAIARPPSNVLQGRLLETCSRRGSNDHFSELLYTLQWSFQHVTSSQVKTNGHYSEP